MAQKPCFFTISSTRARKLSSSKAISGKSSRCGASRGFACASPHAAVIQPACRPITSRMKTFVEVLAIDSTSSPASRMLVATYFATEPNPGQVSVIGKSLSTVFGTCTAVIG